MNNLARLDDRRQIAAAPETPSLPHLIALALTDSPYRVAPWSAADAIFALTAQTDRRDVVRAAGEMRAALQPCGRDWLKKRLSGMALAFGHERDPDRVAAWLQETGRLLWDLPQDILADAIDEGIKRSERGFMPAVGQIRAIADPLVAQRRQQASRLEAMAAMIDGRSTADTVARPWERAAPEKPAPADDRIPRGEVDAFNRNMRKLGITMRARPDGTTFTVEPGDVDPTEREGDVPAARPTANPSQPAKVSGGSDRRGRTPTREDYLRMGVDPAVLDRIGGGETGSTGQTDEVAT